MTKEKWIKEASLFFYQVFSPSYDDSFKEELLKGGGGNSILCGTWSKISKHFINYRISGNAIKRLDD